MSCLQVTRLVPVSPGLYPINPPHLSKYLCIHSSPLFFILARSAVSPLLNEQQKLADRVVHFSSIDLCLY